MTRREVKALLRITQIARAELGFNLDPHQHASSKLPWPTCGACVCHKNWWQCLWMLLLSFTTGLAKGAHLVRRSHGAWFCWLCRHCLLLRVPLPQKAEAWARFLSSVGAPVRAERGQRAEERHVTFSMLVDSATYPWSHFVFLTALGDKNY